MFQNSAGRILLLIGTTAPIACDRLPEPAAPARPPTLAVELVPSTVQPSAVNAVPWGSQPKSRTSASISGNPSIMAPGARCTTFRSLPGTEFYRSTLVQDACLEIPSNTTIVVQSGATLGIVATNGLRIGRNFRFDARGTQGMRGERADFGAIAFTPDSDAKIYAACVENGNRCKCPVGDSNAMAIRGHTGGAGSAGGGFIVVASDLVSSERLEGIDINVTGGRGGPAGESGRVDCRRGSVECSSESCTDGATSGAQGAFGKVYIALGGTNVQKQLGILGKSCVPAEAAAFVPITSEAALQTEVRTLNDTAYQNDWDRRSGQDSS